MTKRELIKLLKTALVEVGFRYSSKESGGRVAEGRAYDALADALAYVKLFKRCSPERRDR